MNQSQTIGALAAALAKAQASYKPAVKDSANPFFKAHFLSLAGALDACREALTGNGLAIVQAVDSSGDKLVLYTTLIHSSGEWIGSAYPINPVKCDPQGIGSATSYARRYSLMALVGLAAEDDDGEAAHGRTAKVDITTGEVRKAQTKLSDNDKAALGIYGAAIEQGLGEEGVKAYGTVKKSLAYSSREAILSGVQSYAKENGIELDNEQFSVFNGLWGKP